jgi:hypothetical protein
MDSFSRPHTEPSHIRGQVPMRKPRLLYCVVCKAQQHWAMTTEHCNAAYPMCQVEGVWRVASASSETAARSMNFRKELGSLPRPGVRRQMSWSAIISAHCDTFAATLRGAASWLGSTATPLYDSFCRVGHFASLRVRVRNYG